MPSDPFAEPSDGEGTIIRPRPSGASAEPARAQPAPARAVQARPVPKVGVNPLVAAASPVLAAAIRVASGRGQPPDPDRFRAKLEVYELINRLTDQGKAVVLVSSELPELMGMSDRIVMLAEGRMGGTFDRAEATQEKLLAAAMGQVATSV